MDWLDKIGDVASTINPLNIAATAIGKLVSGIFSIIAGLMSDAVGGAVSTFATMWMNIPTPVVASDDSAKPVNPQDTAGIMQVLGYVKWISLIIAVFAIVIFAARWAATSRRGDGENAMGRVSIILVAVIGVTSATSLVSMLLQTGPTRVGGVVGKLQSHLWFYMLAAAAVSVMVGMARLMMSKDTRPAEDTLKSLIRLIVVAGAGTTIVQLGLTIGDALSKSLLDASTGGDFNATVTKTLALSGTMPGGVLLVIILALLSLLACLVQIALMILRSGLLVVLTGILPLASANTNTEWGKNWYSKSLGWLVAFVLYKPVASLIYATCFWMIGGNVYGDQSNSFVGPMVGFVFMVCSILALPALMKFAVPAVSALGSGSESGGAAAAAAPTGAMMLARGSSGGSAGSSSPSSTASAPPSGASSTGGATSGGAAAGGAAGGAASGGAASGAAGGPVGAGVALAAKAVKGAKGAVENEAGSGAPASAPTSPSGAAPAASGTSAPAASAPTGSAAAPAAPATGTQASGAQSAPDKNLGGSAL